MTDSERHLKDYVLAKAVEQLAEEKALDVVDELSTYENNDESTLSEEQLEKMAKKLFRKTKKQMNGYHHLKPLAIAATIIIFVSSFSVITIQADSFWERLYKFFFQSNSSYSTIVFTNNQYSRYIDSAKQSGWDCILLPTKIPTNYKELDFTVNSRVVQIEYSYAQSILYIKQTKIDVKPSSLLDTENAVLKPHHILGLDAVFVEKGLEKGLYFSDDDYAYYFYASNLTETEFFDVADTLQYVYG